LARTFEGERKVERKHHPLRHAFGSSRRATLLERTVSFDEVVVTVLVSNPEAELMIPVGLKPWNEHASCYAHCVSGWEFRNVDEGPAPTEHEQLVSLHLNRVGQYQEVHCDWL
jgi:hypothetical protein